MRDGHPQGVIPRVCLETGTYRGVTTRKLATLYEVVETIEISPVLWEVASREPGIRYHLGDSALILPFLLGQYREPVTCYLDAHWFERPEVGGRGQFPLWRELAALKAFVHPNIVIVDDVRMFGSDHEGVWDQVNQQAINDALDPSRIVGTASIHDHYVVYRCASLS